MAKDKTKKRPAGTTAKKTTTRRPSTKQTTVKKAVRTATTKAKAIAANPAVTEIVAASLVAAAAALKNPKKARDMATSVGDELSKASKQSIDRGNNFWALALDVAQRSIEALGGDKAGGRAKAGGKNKGLKKKAKK